MSKLKSIYQLVATTSLLLGIGILGREVAQAESSVFLTDNTCVNTSGGNWGVDNSPVVVNKAVYTSFLFMGAGNTVSSMTCYIKPEKPQKHPKIFKSFYLEFGMRDNDRGSPSNIVKVYLDGILSATQRVSPGQAFYFPFDVSNVSNISIETICDGQLQYCDRVYFFNASLDERPLPISAPTLPSLTPNQIQTPPPPPNQ